MTESWFLAVLTGCAVLAGPACAQNARLAASWVPMIEVCLAYAETGQRAVFDDWAVATPDGGVCDGDPDCEGDEMTFIAPVAATGTETGAVTVRVGAADWVGARYHGRDPAARVVGSAPAHAFCASAARSRHRTADIDAVHRDWIGRALEDGRLVPAEGFVSVAAGPYLGCGYDGRPYLIEFSLARPGPAVLRMNFPARAGPRDGEMGCGGLVS